MPLDSLQPVRNATMLIFSKVNPPAKLIMEWKRLISIVLPNEIEEEKIEYAITSSSAIINKSKEAAFSNDLESLAYVRLFLGISEQYNEYSISRKIRELLESIDAGWEKKTNDKIFEYEELIRKDGFKSKVVTKSSLFPLILDQILRWGTFFYFSSIKKLETGQFENFQYFFIPGFIIAFTYFRYLFVKRRNRSLLINLGLIDSITVVRINSLFYYFFYVLVILAGQLISFLIVTNVGPGLVPPIMTSVLAWIIYLLIIFSLSNSLLSEKNINKQLNESLSFSKVFSIDENDRVIVELKSRLNSLTGRLEAYVLESALFGALAFSGFLQIVSANMVSFNDLSSFAHNSQLLLSYLTGLSEGDGAVILENLTSFSSIFSLISIETLFCSILFLAVIASRLVFSNKTDSISRELSLAEAYNQKEESYSLQKESIDSERLKKINQTIHDKLRNAYVFLRELDPIRQYMQFFRNAGIFTFLLVLITSSLIISTNLAVVFIVLSVASVGYFQRERIAHFNLNFKFYVQYLAINQSYLIVIVSIALVVIGTVSTIFFQYHYYLVFLLFAWVFFFLYRMVLILASPIHDDKFPLEKPISKELRFLWGLSEGMILIGVLLMVSNLPGAGVAMGMGFLIFAVILFRLSFKLSDRWTVAVLAGLTITSCTAAMLFSILHLPGSNELGYISIVFSLFFVILYSVTKSNVHRILKNLLLGVFIISLYSFWYKQHRFAISVHASSFEEFVKVRNAFESLDSENIKDFSNADQIQQVAQLIISDFNGRNQLYARRNFSFRILNEIISNPGIEVKSTDDLSKMREFLQLSEQLYPEVVSMEVYTGAEKRINNEQEKLNAQ